MQYLRHKLASQEIFKSIRDYLPEDHSSTLSLPGYLDQCLSQLPKSAKVLDLGCGEGNSVRLFKQFSEGIVWHGVDIENSPEVRKRTHTHESMKSFNGIDLPYPDKCFDMIFCSQVLEHVRFPDALVADALRTLKPNGLFIGSVSYLEPYHSYSIFNFTPYGIVRVFTDAGFKLEEIRPGVDASSLINRQLLNRSRLLRPLWRQNFLYGIIWMIGAVFALQHRERNFLKIQFSGHLVFLARCPEDGAAGTRR